MNQLSDYEPQWPCDPLDGDAMNGLEEYERRPLVDGDPESGTMAELESDQ